jgi:hypothetical protein
VRRAWLGIALLAPLAAAYADDAPAALPIKKSFKIVYSSDRLDVQTAFADSFDKEYLEKPLEGLTTTVLVRVYLYSESDVTTPLAIGVRETSVVCDIWEEICSVRIAEPGKVTTLTKGTDKTELLKYIAAFEGLPLYLYGPLSDKETYFVAVIAEVNPLSEELVAEARRWLVRASGSSRGGKSSSFFGPFAAIFVNIRQGSAEATIKFRSKSFPGPPPKK